MTPGAKTAAAGLGDPLELPCGVVLRNRIAKAALSEQLGDRRNDPTPRLATLYGRWAAGGAGLLITGNVMVDRRAIGEPANVVLEDARALPALRAWAASVEGTDAAIWMQLNHPGRQSPRHLSRQPVAPSAVAMGSGRRGAFARPRALEHDEIVELVERFATAAELARDAGFGGVQLHAAHGYLFSQFLSPRANVREDEWGGDPARRMRFLLEVVRATRARVGDAFAIGVKLNSADFQKGGFGESDSIDVAVALEAAGIDLLEISGGTYERTAMMGTATPRRASTVAREAYFLDYAAKLRSHTTLPLMVTGGFRSAAAMGDAVAGGAADVIGLGRPLSIEPDLPRELLAGTAERAQVTPQRLGIRSIDGMAEIVWHTQQLHRMAAGRPPAPRRSVTRAVAQALVTNGSDTLRRTRG
ncbi:MAG: oxidoreductase [Thermoleophilia bacterium]|nr:oxidoreductase [Thermoleophilia bacterium]